MKKVIALLVVVSVFLVAGGNSIFANSIGFNASGEWPATHMAGREADGFSNWTDAENASGSGLVLNGSNDMVTVDWSSDNFWSRGPEETSEQALYRVYLDDAKYGSHQGISLSFSGLGDWLNDVGKPGYKIRTYHNTSSTFWPIDIYNNDALIETTSVTNSWVPEGGDGYRGYADTGVLSYDSVDVILTEQEEGRGSICAVKITAVPEPATVALLGMGAVALIRKRR